LLHVTDEIESMGPVWCYWAFAMEQFCGSLLPAIKRKKPPFSSLDHHVRDVAQLSQPKSIYSLAKEL
ncbi:hypothetical protein BOTBODRAFT_82915, partial [Botryobasidium botryosum FD-172 SS1]